MTTREKAPKKRVPRKPRASAGEREQAEQRLVEREREQADDARAEHGARTYRSPKLTPWTPIQRFAFHVLYGPRDVHDLIEHVGDLLDASGEPGAALCLRARGYADDAVEAIQRDAIADAVDEADRAAEIEASAHEDAIAEMQRQLDALASDGQRIDDSIDELAGVVAEAVADNQPHAILEALHAYFMEHSTSRQAIAARNALGRWV